MYFGDKSRAANGQQQQQQRIQVPVVSGWLVTFAAGLLPALGRRIKDGLWAVLILSQVAKLFVGSLQQERQQQQQLAGRQVSHARKFQLS